MYDRETRYPMEETANHGRMFYTEKGVMHMASRRCTIIGISRSGARLGIVTQFHIPREFSLEVLEARVSGVGSVLIRTYVNDTIDVRFLRLLTEKEMNRIFAFSTHPAHRDRVLDVRSW